MLENDDDVDAAATFPSSSQSEPSAHDDFDLLQYVDSSDSCSDSLDEQLMGELESIEVKPIIEDLHEKCPLEQYAEPSSPAYCKSQEIVDYPHDDETALLASTRLSASPIFQQDEMEEPDWLSTWDSA